MWERMIVVLLFFVSCLSFDVGSYNIRSGSNINNTYNIQQTGLTIKSMMKVPFIIGIQEVDINTERHPQNQPEILANITESFPTFAKMRDFENGSYGILILSSIQPIESKIFRYSKNGDDSSPSQCKVNTPRDFCQGAVAVLVEIEGKKIYFVTTHLGLSGVQEEEAKQLYTFLKSLQYPYFLTGDMNSIPSSSAIQFLQSNLNDLGMKCSKANASRLTFNSSVPTEEIDYVFASRNNPFDCVEATVIDTQTSDHRPVVVSLSLS